MKDVKTIIDARVAQGAKTVKNVTLRSIYLCNPSDNGRIPIIVKLNKDVPSMVQVTEEDLTKLQQEIDRLTEAVKTESDAEKKAALKEELANTKALEASLEVGTWIKGMSDTIFTSNYELLAILRQSPKTAFAADMARDVPEFLKEIFLFAKTNILAEEVETNQEYTAPFSDVVNTIPNDSIYHTLYNTTLCEDGMDFVKELKKRHMDMLMSKLAEKSKKGVDFDDSND